MEYDAFFNQQSKALAEALERYFLIEADNPAAADIIFTKAVKPILKTIAQYGLSEANAIKFCSRFTIFEGELMTKIAAREAELKLLQEVGVKSGIRAFVGVADVLAWVALLALPAGAEGMRDPDNRLAYANYVKRDMGLRLRSARFDGARRLPPLLGPTHFMQALYDANPAF